MRIKERYNKVIEWFKENMPVAETELNYNNPFELIVAVVLSAQCTDKRVNMITPGLFAKYPDAESMSKASVEDILTLIASCSFPNNKAKHLSGLSKMLVEKYHGEVQDEKQPT